MYFFCVRSGLVIQLTFVLGNQLIARGLVSFQMCRDTFCVCFALDKC